MGIRSRIFSLVFLILSLGIITSYIIAERDLTRALVRSRSAMIYDVMIPSDKIRKTREKILDLIPI